MKRRPVKSRLLIALMTLQPLEDRGNALAAADTHRHQPIATTGALQLVERFDGQDASRGANRMAQRDCAPIRVDLLQIEAEVLGHRARLCCECPVWFDALHVPG